MQLLEAPYGYILNRSRALGQWRRKNNMSSEKQEENIKQKVKASTSTRMKLYQQKKKNQQH